MIERKLNLEVKYTDLFEGALNKKYKVKTDHKTMLIVQELFSKKQPTEEDDDKAMCLLLGAENWKEIKNYIENQPNYQENMTVTKIEIFSIAFNIDFEVMAERFQKTLKG
jgi:hypothetical protein